MATLEQLADKYFGSGASDVYKRNSTVEPLIDGEDYFRAVFNAINGTSGSSDFIHISGWFFDKNMKLGDLDIAGIADPTKGKLLADILKEKQSLGVDVKVLVMGSTPFDWYYEGVMRSNVAFTVQCRLKGIKNIIIDKNADFIGSHHVKSVIVMKGGVLHAFMGGIDFVMNRYDTPEHLASAAGYIGWHDAGVKVMGNAAMEVWKLFYIRWNNCIENKTGKKYYVSGEHIGRDSLLNLGLFGTYSGFNYQPDGLSAISDFTYNEVESSFLGTTQSSDIAVRIGKACSEGLVEQFRELGWEAPYTWPPEDTGFVEYWDTLKIAIPNATKYIYIEDQTLNSGASYTDTVADTSLSIIYNLIFDALKRGVKTILVTSGIADPADNNTNDLTKIGGQIKEYLLEPLGYNTSNPVSDASGNPAYKNLALYTINYTVIHTKLIIIDDEFLSIGSANAFDRSLMGTDTELTCMAVSGNGFGSAGDHLAKNVRKRLWLEWADKPLSKDPTAWSAQELSLWNEVDDPVKALGIWSKDWRSPAGSFFSFDTSLTLLSPPGDRLYKMLNYLY